MSTIIAYLTRSDDGDPAMLHFDLSEAVLYCGDETPEPLVLLSESDAELARLRAECERLRGERVVLVRLLIEADKVLSTLDGECQEEQDQLADLRRAIAAATIPHRPEEADLLSLRACIGA